MNQRILLPMLFVLLFPTAALAAPHIEGTWQGETAADHLVLVIRETPGGLSALFYYRSTKDDPGDSGAIPVYGLNPHGEAVQFDIGVGGHFNGKLSDDGNQFVGIWQGEGPPTPLTLVRTAPARAWVVDPSRHKVRFVNVEKSVRLEVLDFGGNGSPLIFLPGLGNSAHVFDDIAPEFTSRHHVYAISRRGFGLSTMPPPIETNYNPDRLGEDVIAVMDALKLDRPFVAGHSIGGEELSFIGTRHPSRVSGLIYLDATYAYAYYAPKGDPFFVDLPLMRRELARLGTLGPADAAALAKRLAQFDLPQFQRELRLHAEIFQGSPNPPPSFLSTPQIQVENAISTSVLKFGSAKSPVLAIIAVPHACTPLCNTPSERARREANIAQADAFERGNPSAKIVRIAYGDHYVFRSNKSDVVREMTKFMDAVDRTRNASSH